MGRADPSANSHHHHHNNNDDRGIASDFNVMAGAGAGPSNAVTAADRGQGLGMSLPPFFSSAAAAAANTASPRRTSRPQQMPSPPPVGICVSPSGDNGSIRSNLSPIPLGSLLAPRRRSHQQNNNMDIFQQRFLQDMDEAEPWQRELIKFHRDETDKNKSNIGAGAGTRAGAREPARPVSL